MKSHFHLVVKAFTSGTSTETEVDIRVTDVNEHPPRFPQNFYEAEIKEESRIGTEIIQV